MYRHFPEVRANLPPFDFSEVGKSVFNYNSTKVQRELGVKFTSLETMVVDTISFILALHKQNN